MAGDVKLTKAQRKFLQEAYDNRRDYGTGRGAKAWNRFDVRVANTLERMGLITQPPMYTSLLGAHITDAGLSALRSQP